MWEFLSGISEAHGVTALFAVAEAILIGYLFKQLQTKDVNLAKSNTNLQELAEQRLKDVKESTEDYEDLSRDLNRSLDILIKILSK